jgi:chromosome partitioning protein
MLPGKQSMALVIGVVSQKGGVGKSTCVRLIAREYAEAGWDVKIADLDISQSTSFDWHVRRLEQQLQPSVAVERFGTIEQALKAREYYDLIVMDGAPHSTAATLKIVEASTLSVLPTGLSLEDLKPQVLLAHELVKKGVEKRKLVFALCRVGDSSVLQQSARDYITQAGYHVLSGSLPERLAYLKAAEEGRALTETRFPTLNERAAQMVQGVIDLATKLEEEQAA